MGNLKYQLQSAINENFVLGYDKYASKRDSSAKDTVVSSDSTAKSLCKTAGMLADFVKEKNLRAKMAKYVSVDICNRFLEYKANTCDNSTLGKLASHIKKIGKCVSEKYATCNVDWSKDGGLIVPESRKSQVSAVKRVRYEKADFESCVDYIKNNTKSDAWKAIELSGRFGLRVEGCEKITANMVNLDAPGRYGFGQIELYKENGKGIEKGGRPRIIDIRTASDADFIRGLCNGKTTHDRLVGLSSSRINGALGYAKNELGLKEKYHYSGIHGCRKMWAQNMWDSNKREGMSFGQNVRYCNNQLGHGDNRGVRGISAYINAEPY